ncbi:tetratricopeptide repeat (TPR)-like superfamily protein [Wolffia australiana]
MRRAISLVPRGTRPTASAVNSIVKNSPSFIMQNKDLLQILDLIDAGEVVPDLGIYSDLVRLCANCRLQEHARLVHAHFQRSHFTADVFLNNSFINMYCKCGAMAEAQQIFDGMLERDMVSWTALISGYSTSATPEKAISLFPRMLAGGFFPNAYTLASLVKACGAMANGPPVCTLHCFSVKYGLNSSVFVGSAMVDVYARQGRTDEARKLFLSLPAKNEVSWNALIAGFSREGDVDSAMESFVEMQRSSGFFKASHYTYSSMFVACARIGSLEQGKWVHAHLVKSGCTFTIFLGNTLLAMYAKSGAMDDARKLFQRLRNKDLVSWNTILTACAQHGLGREAGNLLKKMIEGGRRPNEVTFLAVLTASSRCGLLEQGEEFFKMMGNYEIAPRAEHYATMVDLLARAGLLLRAESFISEMPIKPTAAVWGALLGACRMHKNWKLGELAAMRALELDPLDSGVHMLLYNLYACCGRWAEAAGVRKKMKELGVKKEPACSWVEVGNSVHVFVADDDSHPQREEIQRLWQRLHEKIKDLGYAPDVDHVLLFMDEGERENRLQSHSERMALAFALLNLPPSAPIRIKKNIRVCGDCHVAFKLVSGVLNRDIIVRDTNRFHHFRSGGCSCGDYW